MSQAEEIQVAMDDAKHHVNTREALLRLESNPDFQTIVAQAYFKDEAARLVMARSNPALNEQQRDAVLMMIDGIGSFASFLNEVHRRGMEMEAALKDHETALEEVHAEELS